MLIFLMVFPRFPINRLLILHQFLTSVLRAIRAPPPFFFFFSQTQATKFEKKNERDKGLI